MPMNPSGVASPPAGTTAVSGQVIESAPYNAMVADIYDVVTDHVATDGRKAMTGNLPMGSNKITSLADGTAKTDAANLGQVQIGVVSHAATVGGTVDAITATFSPTLTAYTSKMKVLWTSAGVNTVTNPTINLDSLGTKTIKKGASAALAVGDTGASGYICEAVYDGTDFILQNPATAANFSYEYGQGTDVASASTITLGNGKYFNVTGTTAITDIDLTDDYAGREFTLKFAGALTLTDGANLILQGGSDILTVAGDTADFVSEGSDVIRMTNYMRAAEKPENARLVKASNTTITSNTTLANDATLQFNAEANKRYVIRCKGFLQSGSAQGYKIGFTTPSTPTSVFGACLVMADTTSTTAGYVNTAAGAFIASALGGATQIAFEMHFVLNNGANSGTFAIQFAQNSSSATATTIRSGSWLEYEVF